MVGQTSDSSDYYVSGGVNWAGFTLAELVAMVDNQASVPQLERLAQDWRETGEGVVAASDYLADALDDLMNYWTGTSADKARHVVALNAQWVSDLGTTAREMSGPIEEAAGALKAAQEAMPPLPTDTPAETAAFVPGAAPRAAADMSQLTGSPLGAAIAASAEGTSSGLTAQARQEELKRIAVETMQRFETAAVGIDRTTPRFLGQDTELRPDPDDVEVEPSESVWISTISQTSGVDLRWQLLTGVTDPSSGAPYPGGGFTGGFDGSGGYGSYGSGGLGGTGSGGGVGVGALPMSPGSGRTGLRTGGRPELGGLPGRGMPTSPAGAVIGGPGGGSAGGHYGPMAAPMGAGMGMGNATQPHRRRFPFDADDPFDTGQKASPPVIGL
ncbi:hypothetical protein [Actinophytocola gossypii]|uniref:PPE domain-containing protein n=1 Tax=Actinophytocola gossypii TaxID=2812003 RepID=A0ABT2JHQ5_9PSEU|nr:hypothetical protein [Actinophytocola gossypii]MCT2587415.1 hypothetical protein [Actinophytocola gossypii]